MRTSRLFVLCALGFGLMATLPVVRAEVQKNYIATKNESIVWLEQVFDTRAAGNDSSNGQQTLSYFAGFTHAGKKYASPTRVFLGVNRKVETTNSRNSSRSRRFADVKQMVVSVKGNRTTLACSYTDDRNRDGDTVILSEKMVADVSMDLLKKMSNAGKVTIGFLSGTGEFLGEYNIGESYLQELGELVDRVPKKDR